MLLIVTVVTIGLTLDKAIKAAVENVGPKITGVEVKLDKVSLSILSGSGSLHGFLLGNPEGYKMPSSMEFTSSSLAIKPVSLLSDKIVIHHIRLDAPVITFEGGLKGNNLSDLVNNMKTGKEDEPEDEEATDEEEQAISRKFQVDEISLTGATLHAIIKELGDETNTFVLPDIKLTDLGTGPDGITAGELGQLVLVAVAKEAVRAVIESDGSLERMGEAAIKRLDESGNEDTGNLIRGVMEFFKKKE